MQFARESTPAALGQAFCSCVVEAENFTFRCALGISEQRQGAVRVHINQRFVRWEHHCLEPILEALAQRARLSSTKLPTQADLVGVVVIDGSLGAGNRLTRSQLTLIRKALEPSFAVLLDAIPGGRELLDARWGAPP